MYILLFWGGQYLDGGTCSIQCTKIQNSAAPVGQGLNTTATLSFPALSAKATLLITTATTPPSDGLQYISIIINTTALGLTTSAGLLGVSVPIERA